MKEEIDNNKENPADDNNDTVALNEEVSQQLEEETGTEGINIVDKSTSDRDEDILK